LDVGRRVDGSGWADCTASNVWSHAGWLAGRIARVESWSDLLGSVEMVRSRGAWGSSMSTSLGGVVARLGVVLVLTTIAEAGAKLSQEKQGGEGCDRMAGLYTVNL
jgi:hypothetical protein